MYVCRYVCVCVCLCVCVRMWLCVYLRVSVYVCMHTCTYVRMCTCIQVFYSSASLRRALATNKYNLDPLLICIVGGFVCVNFSHLTARFAPHAAGSIFSFAGDHTKSEAAFAKALHRTAPAVFLPFFTLVGASLDIRTASSSLGFALVLASARIFSIFAASAASGYLVGQSRHIFLSIWATLVSQAGFALGIAAEIATQFPRWGRQFQAVIIACVIVNQVRYHAIASAPAALARDSEGSCCDSAR